MNLVLNLVTLGWFVYGILYTMDRINLSITARIVKLKAIVVNI